MSPMFPGHIPGFLQACHSPLKIFKEFHIDFPKNILVPSLTTRNQDLVSSLQSRLPPSRLFYIFTIFLDALNSPASIV